MPELDARKQSILQAIIIEYISGAEPIGSEALVHKYSLGVKSATVRNEMSEMSDLGYLEQPHTSAGRIPSDLGYRYYVDRLIVTAELEANAKQKVTDAANTGDALQSLLRDTVGALSRLTRLLGVATTVRDGNVTIRAAMLSALGPSQALLVVALSNGYVENRLVECPSGLTLADVGRANEILMLGFVGQELRNISRAKPPNGENPAVEKLISVLWANIRALARQQTRGSLVTSGEEFLFAQPEFQRDAAPLADLLTNLIDSDMLYESIAPHEQGRPVTIGREHRHEAMRPLSVIRHSFHVGEREAGVIALVGPTRMRYDVGIPLVTYTAKALSASLTRFLG